ncbi:class I adenylate-forming enzyme family protein [Streptomyces sp. RKAG293]|uniref:class I adenylate-forming enzyme family protein n=1 Tax=Streptomyces sp. RKAG293 TaxID=2893403 RepID=UPI002033BF0F|nr:class I adenylate-forming enzyme family protein [Streptomyces sp. RKAG293]MCM2417822.1 acyl--CoA ligase [Streptomyces sp. RKAG293]
MTVRQLRAQLAADQELGVGNVLSTLVARAGESAESALTFDSEVDGHPAWQRLTLPDLERAVTARAAWLHTWGVQPRDAVAVFVSTAADHVLAYLALARIGAIPALLNANMDGTTARAYIGKVAPRALLTDAAHRARLGDGEFPGLLLGDIAETGTGDPALAPGQYRFHPTDAAVITHSSGTTGLPKPVIATHASLFAASRHRLSLPKPRTIDRMLSALPANHAAMVIAVTLALCSGTELMLVSEQDGLKVLEAVDRWKPSCVFGFAATWPQLVNRDLSAYDLDSVQMWWNTGDAAHEAHIRKLVAVGHRLVAQRGGGIARKEGATFMDGLGSSEMGHSMFFITHTAETDRYNRCIGKPHAFAEVAVLDELGEPLPPGRIGELGVNAPTVSPGYWNDSATTYRTRRAGYFLTGDLVYRDEAGYYYHVDRVVDTVALSGGRYLHTAQSEEQILARCPEVSDCTVIAVPGPDGAVTTEVLVSILPGAKAPADLDEQVRGALDEHVAATVRSVVVVDDEDIPHGPTGKVRKVILRERYSQAKAMPVIEQGVETV